MIRLLAASGALMLGVAFAGVASAQTYLPDWGVADMRAAVVASGAQIVREDNATDPYIAAKTAEGLKFTITGRVCAFAAGATSGPKRCRGAFLQTRLNYDSQAEVDAAVKRWGPEYAAVSVTDGGDTDLLVSRYLIFDNGVHRDNLKVNISVFYGIAEEIWGEM